ncbi:MAG: hypothetical protein E6230_24865 [Paenibacillus dendritiformis]|uniref:hypothetical protein n=1 Tax=uncultured Paenibacillus sp. TaxID=227322 RepID=UPI0025F54B1A|nr:hypothetical protein [uncultured Paenibacillus sp.]MDU5145413.1 hypothetical protein [Paenibacillus dendritiformis]
MKKLFSLAFAMVLMLTLSVSAFAHTSTPENGANSPAPEITLLGATLVDVKHISEVEPLASGNLSPGAYTTFDRQSLAEGNTVTLAASWTPTSSNLDVGIYSHASGYVYYYTFSGGSGSGALGVNTSGTYSIYVGNPSDAQIRWDVSYTVN